MLTKLMMRVANSHRLLAACILGDLIICGETYSSLEHHGPIEGMWWAVVTGSTVGYGDQYPKTTAGRFVGMVLIATMILFVAIATAQLSAKLIVNSDAWTDDEQELLKAKIHSTLAAVERIECLMISMTSERTSGPSTASSGTPATRSPSTTSPKRRGISGWSTRRLRGWRKTSHGWK